MKAAAGAAAGMALDLPDGHKHVPNFNLPSALSGKLWKSMRMTPKKLECEKEFYEKILRAPCQVRIVWKCVGTCDGVRQGAKPTKARATKLKLPKVSSPSSSPPTQGSVSSSASMSLKAKLLAAAPSPCDTVELTPGDTQAETPSSLDSPCQSVPPSTPESPVKNSPKEVQPNKKDEMSDDLEWGGGGRRGESGNGVGRRRKSSLGKRKKSGGGERDEGASKRQEDDSKCESPPQPVRLKLRRLPTATSMSPSSRASDKASAEHAGLGRRESVRHPTSEPESPDSTMEMSDQALALKLHYAMNHRPSRRSQRVSKAVIGSSMASSKTEEQEEKLFAASPETSF
ncbi:hypothetical protein BSKO_00792 [Bryopsis sp. KO-2023]|nr:hypothetical protein BSKO_00792 [Bryopsis sp. KO-2023]